MKMKNKLIKSEGYEKLVANINKELNDLEFLIKKNTVLTYWRIGRYISAHLMENKERAGYGDHLFERLAQSTGRDKRTLERTVQFYKDYPQIASRVTQLSWTHYLHLLTVSDETERKQLQEQAINKGWNAPELKRRIKALKEKETKTEPEEIPQLEFTRGRLHIYKLIESKSGVDIDLGFKMRLDFEGENASAGDYIEPLFHLEGGTGFQKVSISEENLFTYIAKVEDEGVIDGDTIEAAIYCDFKMKIIQTLRFRGIDCPEIDTPEGKRAKKFVEDRLKGLEFIVVKTYKDRSEKYGRYLADIFYKRGETDPQKVADTGNFLNQELLDAGLAKKV